ncbi:MAG: ribosome small subunit-dependent GTPase A [Lachnospiraceae bacterium]|nr:ribosome small subunit-dependent GTPase A [Lachnospiraceae bacterium]
MEECIGKIMKGVGGLYEVYVEDLGPVTCRAKGILRYNDIKPLIGDNVKLTVLDEKERTGNLTEVLPRRNALIRPAVANVDQAMVVFAVKEPEPHLNLLDRFLLLMAKENLPVVICFNKTDQAGGDELSHFRKIYEKSGAKVLFAQANNPDTMDEVYAELLGKTTVLAGPSGVGKSTIMNFAQPEAAMETGELSEKIRRGKNTTRHAQLNYVTRETYLCDTPGFSSLFLPEIEPEELRLLYNEFKPYEEQCRFPDCVHRKEPGCAVKEAVEKGDIAKERYENYLLLYEELAARRKW